MRVYVSYDEGVRVYSIRVFKECVRARGRMHSWRKGMHL